MSRLFLPLILLLAASLLAADTRQAPIVTPLEIDENGAPIILVMLHSKSQPEVTRNFRFILDTGAGITVVDQRIPAAFRWDDLEAKMKMKDAVGETREAASVFIKRLEVGGIIQDDLRATVQDLQGLLGHTQDRPVDGILGMNFLDRTRFTLDMKARTVTWWTEPRSGMTELKAGRGSDGMVYALLQTGKAEVPAMVDTGMAGGIDLPEQQAPEGEGLVTAAGGLYGGILKGTQKRMPRLACGDLAWLDVPVDFEPNTQAGVIGEEVWSCGPVWFDLVGSPRIRISLDEKGDLPFNRGPSRRLPVVWEGSGGARRMLIALVKPGSAMDKAGCKVGDQVLQAGELKNETLTRRGVQDLAASGKAHTWTVLRDGKNLQIPFAPSRLGGQGTPENH